MRIVVLGAGNLLMMDEGVGVHAVQRMLAAYVFPPEVSVLDGGTASMEMLEDLENLDTLIVVDAVYAHQAVAETIKLVDSEVKAFFRRKLSPHQIGLADVLASLEFIGREPKHLVVIGVKPVELELGMELTPRIEAQVPKLIQMVIDTLEELGYPAVRKAA
jgi:hydrogenase maturation protease